MSPVIFSETDRALYERLLREIPNRVSLARNLIDGDGDVMALELAALHVRKVLELAIFESFVANRAAVEPIASALHKKDVDAARKLAKRANSAYWPQPVRQVPVGKGEFQLEDLQEGFLRENEWGKAYGSVSELLHAPNPYDDQPLDVAQSWALLRDLLSKIILLLNHHKVILVDAEVMLVAQVLTTAGDVQVAVFRKIDADN
jgi:hypothetical protein